MKFEQLIMHSLYRRLCLVSLMISISTSLQTEVVAFDIGCHHSCGLMRDGEVFCWGRSNDFGQIHPRQYPQPPPQSLQEAMLTGPVNTIDNIQVLSLGCYHTCILSIDGVLECWGRVPQSASSNHFIKHIQDAVDMYSTSFTTCVLTQYSRICWGQADNHWPTQEPVRPATPTPTATYTQSATLSTSGTTSVTATPSITTSQSVSATSSVSVTITSSNSPSATTTSSTSPTSSFTPTLSASMSPFARVQHLKAGGLHTCAVTTQGAVKCWGGNSAGQLGLGFTSAAKIESASSYVAVGDAVFDIALGTYHTCAILNSTRAFKCWGGNYMYESGYSGQSTITAPFPGPGLTFPNGVRHMTAGYRHTCALTTSHQVFCFGERSKVGVNVAPESINASVAVEVNFGGNPVRTVESFYMHTCAVLFNGNVRCWGWNYYGQLGKGDTVDGTLPVSVALYAEALQITVGARHTCAIVLGGSVVCWGSCENGRLGVLRTEMSTAPSEIDALEFQQPVAAVQAGEAHTCVLLESNELICYGKGKSYATGSENTTDIWQAVSTPPLSLPFNGVTSGNYHTCARMLDGRVLCWGSNADKQLGIITPSEAASFNNATPIALPLI